MLADAKAKLAALGKPLDPKISKLLETAATKTDESSPRTDVSAENKEGQQPPAVGYFVPPPIKQLSQLQPGSTMQEMATFQQAATQAMQAAAHGMQSRGIIHRA